MVKASLLLDGGDLSCLLFESLWLGACSTPFQLPSFLLFALRSYFLHFFPTPFLFSTRFASKGHSPVTIAGLPEPGLLQTSTTCSSYVSPIPGLAFICDKLNSSPFSDTPVNAPGVSGVTSLGVPAVAAGVRLRSSFWLVGWLSLGQYWNRYTFHKEGPHSITKLTTRFLS